VTDAFRPSGPPPEPRPGAGHGITVALTCWNAAWCIERALDSVFAQTVPPDEVLVTDDGSTDDTVARIEARYGDAVRVLRLPHRGLTPTRRQAIAEARGPWIALLDADDTWLPQRLEKQVAFLQRHPALRWLSTDGMLVSADGVLRESWLSAYFSPVRDLEGDLFPFVVERCFPLLSSSLFHKDAYEAVGGLDSDVEWSQDYALWLRLSARYPGGLLADRLTTYWSSATQLSKRIEERYRDDQRLMERVARGEYRRDRVAQRIAREKIASYDYDLGITCLRSGRWVEGRRHMRRAAIGPGPWRRRALALLGAFAPRGARARLMRWAWLKRTVDGSRRRNPVMGPGNGREEA